MRRMNKLVSLGEYKVRDVRVFTKLIANFYCGSLKGLDNKVLHEVVLESTQGDRIVTEVNTGKVLIGDIFTVIHNREFDYYKLITANGETLEK